MPAWVGCLPPFAPASTEYVPIDGAVHSFFGDYGLQNGDGTPAISRTDAQRQIAEASIRFLESLAAPDAG